MQAKAETREQPAARRPERRFAPAGTWSAQRLPLAHPFTVPVVRELPRPIPHGLGGSDS